MKYMLMMFGDQATMLAQRDDQWVRGMLDFMDEFIVDLQRSGELVGGEGLADPPTARTVSLADGQVVVSDGPFAEAKESLAGFWIVDVADEARAVALASRVATWAERVEVRAIVDAPPRP